MKICSILIILFIGTRLYGQSSDISLDQAIKKAIIYNYDINIVKNEAEIDKVNNSWTNAGAYPVIFANITPYIALNNLKQKLNNGTETNTSNALLQTVNASVEINWNVLNGFKLYTTKKRLETIQTIGEIELKTQINQTAYDVIVAYHDILRLQKQLITLREQIGVADERVTIAKKRFDVGNTGKSDYLQAQLDNNEFKSSALSIENNIRNAQAQLNNLMGSDPLLVINPTDSILLRPIEDRESIKAKAQTKSPEIIALQYQVDVGILTRKELKAAIYPSVNVGAAYSYNRNQNEAGFNLFTQNYGPSAQVNINIPIYDGNRVREQLKVADLMIANQKLEVSKLKADYLNRIVQAYNNYENAIRQSDIEKENFKIATENLGIARARYERSSITSVEFRQIQFSLIDTNTKLYNSLFNAKIAESELLLLTGDIL
jgi:outer membrane protein